MRSPSPARARPQPQVRTLSLTRRKVIMACANYWQSPFRVGSHQLARAFVEAGWEVAFVSDPITPFHVATGLRTDLRQRIRTYRSRGISDLEIGRASCRERV